MKINGWRRWALKDLWGLLGLINFIRGKKNPSFLLILSVSINYFPCLLLRFLRSIPWSGTISNFPSLDINKSNWLWAVFSWSINFKTLPIQSCHLVIRSSVIPIDFFTFDALNVWTLLLHRVPEGIVDRAIDLTIQISLGMKSIRDRILQTVEVTGAAMKRRQICFLLRSSSTSVMRNHSDG